MFGSHGGIPEAIITKTRDAMSGQTSISTKHFKQNLFISFRGNASLTERQTNHYGEILVDTDNWKQIKPVQ